MPWEYFTIHITIYQVRLLDFLLFLYSFFILLMLSFSVVFSDRCVDAVGKNLLTSECVLFLPVLFFLLIFLRRFRQNGALMHRRGEAAAFAFFPFDVWSFSRSHTGTEPYLDAYHLVSGITFFLTS